MSGDGGKAFAAVTIDLDGARHYHAIHGLPPPARDRIVADGLDRFVAFARAHDVKATIFIVTRDLEDADVRAAVVRAHEAGHELASHSHAHRYDLSRQAPAAIEADLARSIDALTALTGARPRGFRAPGYNHSEALMDALEKLGFAYDSSFLRAPLYWAARAAMIGVIRARGRRSASLVGDVGETMSEGAFVPQRANRMQPARSRVDGRALVEIPISGVAGVPFIGAALAGTGVFARGAGYFSELVTRAPGPAVLELHAIDFLDDSEVDDAIARAQPELRVARAKRELAFGDAVTMMKRVRTVTTLAEIASAIR